jgi:hypothetical protein
MGMRGMGGMGRMSGTMPPTMGMMMLSRMIMYFCGDPESWDMRAMMIGMMGMRGMMGGGMGMMGGMGGGGGMMGGMGGMRSVPATALPSALLNPRQSRHLPTRLVSITRPNPEVGLALPEKGEPLQLVDIGTTSSSAVVQKAMRRLATDMAPTAVSQLVMWNLAAGMDWTTIAEMSQKWANRYELTLAKDFVDHLDAVPEGETGRILFEVDGTDEATAKIADDLRKAIRRKVVLGLMAEVGIPPRPDSPAVACRVQIKPNQAYVQVTSSDGAARNWVPFGKFTLPMTLDEEKFDAGGFVNELTEGVLNRLVRAQVAKGTSREKGKLIYQVRIENASPLVLNGLALLGTTSKEGETPKVLLGISVSPRRSMTVPATEAVVKTLGLKQGIRVVALNLSGL